VYIALSFSVKGVRKLLGILGTLSTRAIKRVLILVLTTLVVVAGLAGPAAAARDRTLYLYYTHTKETAKFTYKRNGRFDKKVLAELNYFLRDWRRNEPTKMDPRLFDLIWEVYREAGASKPVHVVSAYRSPKTNEMLRSRSRAVAKNSNHTRGLAMDFFIPGISVSKLRQIAMKKQMGGVGYYPTSGNPFVHLDTGSVRAWPRMSTAQLKKLFPKGTTLHVPSNGVVLSKQGYATAQAAYKRCRQVPCNGASTRVASASTSEKKSKGGSGRTLMDVLFGRDNENVEVAKKPTSIGAPIKVAALGQLPPQRPSFLPDTLENPQTDPLLLNVDDDKTLLAVSPPIQPEAIRLVTASLSTTEQADEALPSRFAVASIVPDDETSLSRFALDTSTQQSFLPQAVIRTGALPDANAAAALLAAYAPTAPTASPDAQKALEIILNRHNGTTQPQRSISIRDALATASLHADLSDFGNILSTVKKANTKPSPKLGLVNIGSRPGQLFDPEIEDEFSFESDPIKLQHARFAVLFEPDIGDLAPTSVLGSGTQLGFAYRAPPIAPTNIGFKTASSL